VKILLLEPADRDPAAAAKIMVIRRILAQLGHQVIEQDFNDGFFNRLVDEKPQVVFNLASVYAWEKTAYLPAILEIAGARYTGSGFLTLSLLRHPVKLLPLLEKSGIRMPPYRIVKAGEPAPAGSLRYPLSILRDDRQTGVAIASAIELQRALQAIPPQEELALREIQGNDVVRVFILDAQVFPRDAPPSLLQPALDAYHLIEARGLARFDFLLAGEPLLTAINAAPDPLDPGFIRAAASAGLDETAIIRTMIAQAGSD
jgi:D-alanine-D-alanine ligase and related ATP-grasp enzymes